MTHRLAHTTASIRLAAGTIGGTSSAQGLELTGVVLADSYLGTTTKPPPRE